MQLFSGYQVENKENYNWASEVQSLMWSCPRDISVFWLNLKGFFSTHHLSWVSSSSLDGCKCLSIPNSNITSFQYFPAFLGKTHKERRTWLWRRSSPCQNREFGHSLWCHGSIFSLVALGSPVAGDVSKRNSCFTPSPISLLFKTSSRAAFCC